MIYEVSCIISSILRFRRRTKPCTDLIVRLKLCNILLSRKPRRRKFKKQYHNREFTRSLLGKFSFIKSIRLFPHHPHGAAMRNKSRFLPLHGNKVGEGGGEEEIRTKLSESYTNPVYFKFMPQPTMLELQTLRTKLFSNLTKIKKNIPPLS